MNTEKTAQVSHVEISEDHAGQRIDNFLLTHLKGVPKSHIYRILRSGEVRVNKGRIKPDYRLQAGDLLRLPPVQTATRTEVTPHQSVLKALQASILYEDAKLLVINKPSGLAVHGGSGVQYGVIEGLRALYPQANFLELVHRLDRETSGCLMIAKKSSVLRQLHAYLRDADMNKQYLALVQGKWSARVKQVNAPLRKNILQSGERVVRVNDDGKPSLSEFRIVELFKQATLMRVHPVTGRTHQIRVHATHTGHPIAGDEKYGDDNFNRALRQQGLNRLFLHAAELTIQLPEQKPLTVKAPLPEPLEAVLAQLRR
ncbi:23S rRNA pseudouridine(955/2504/2580) synthase RluC [Beggiatoa leptomitoformis]|uniref:Pseudouridine synthase n=1 Tax=Beggiatoa leptomitoformis TaxID=288004 RepID=A0A2N9YFL2_9GAMM|nr:23S rRNA pseudouridine(955/2504/2580) synthase RluC [Beggiatoa leptomitoformis]ALG68403.1 23S rRNA pseudouridine(955/2504/2580) synthase RluC [Beggiatoa leptomitoformis]AUI69270.1 23S rRNA pseudouridine(955/2504/2580) synthase RluC [Beggiatoa leptomitoformis]